MNGIARWARKFGVARAVCLLLLFALIPLRLADPRPLAELRARTFDLFQVLWPREQSSRPVVIVDANGPIPGLIGIFRHGSKPKF